MHVASRSYLATGAALVSASAIAISPIAPPVPDIALPAIHASSATVALSAMANPLVTWGAVIEASLANLNGIGQQWLDDPAPLLRQILANQLHMATNLPAVAQALVARLGQMDPADPTSVPATIQQFITNQMASPGIVLETLQTVIQELSALMDPANEFGVPATVRLMLDQFASGEFENGFITFASLGVAVGFPVIMAGFPIAGVISAPFRDLANIIDPTGVASQPLRNLANFIDTVPSVLPGVLLNGLLGPLNSAGLASAATLEDLVGAAMSADPVTFVSALLNAPAKITDAFLNGTLASGDFPMAGLIGGPFGISAIGSVMSAIKSLASAIAPPGATFQSSQRSLEPSSPESVGASPLNFTDSTTVTLDIAPKTDVSDVAPAVTEPSVTEPSAIDAEPAVDLETGIESDLEAEPGETGTGTTEPDDTKPVNDDVTDSDVTEGSVTPTSNAESATAGSAGAGASSSESSASADSGSADGAGGDAA